MSPDATPLDAYLASLPADRREAFVTVLAAMRARMPDGYEEAASGGMVCWQVPLAVYPDTYNEKPLMYAALAWQKNHLGVYLCNAYGMPVLRARLEAGYAAAGKKLDMGASCIQAKRLSDLPLDVIGDVVAATPMPEYVAHAKAVYAATKTGQRKAARS